jgi:hypothetical protein
MKLSEEDVSARINGIFEQCPQLVGFTVETVSALPEALRPEGIEEGLVVTDMAVYPLVNREQCQAIYESLTVGLLELLSERPAAKDALPGRTFVRALH